MFKNQFIQNKSNFLSTAFFDANLNKYFSIPESGSPFFAALRICCFSSAFSTKSRNNTYRLSALINAHYDTITIK